MYNTIVEIINSSLIDYETNNQVRNLWRDPIVAIISAKDNKLKILQNVVSNEHFMPADILPDAKSIISFFIPFQENIAKSNVKGLMASKEWATAYMNTNNLIKTINDNVEQILAKKGYKTGKIPATHNFDPKKLISNWSHRHIAYIAGLGTFGINNMLITNKGCCGRFGSIIINYEFDEYKQIGEIKEKCLNKLNGSCGICQKKCSVNAYENNKYNRHKCYEQCLTNGKYYKEYDNSDICGKCLVGLPCSIKEPSIKEPKRTIIEPGRA
jgi:epoxyqueuosine reductase QueG